MVLLVAILSLSACASSPRYVAADDAGDYGYYARKISDDRYRVNFNGNRHTGLQDTRDYALLRAAELTLAQGNDWFLIVDRETATIESRQADAGFGYERAWYTQRSCGLISCRESVRPATYTTWRIDSGKPDQQHSHSIEIVMGKGETPEDGNYYDAKDVADALGEAM
jgi:hypothetical protein